MNLLVSDGDLLVNGYLLQSSQLTRSERDRRRAKREIGERGCRDFVPLCDWPILRDLAADTLRTTLFEPFEILRRSNQESYRKEKEIAGSGRDLENWLPTQDSNHEPLG